MICCYAQPRAIVCCGSDEGSVALSPAEAALVVDIVGDAENTMVKCAGLNGLASIPEEMIDIYKLKFLLVHPPFKNKDLHVQQWTAVKHETAKVDGPPHGLSWTPFPNPAVQFVVIKMAKAEEQTAGDLSSEAEKEHPPVEIMFTMTRVPPSESSAHASDSLLRSSKSLAKHLGADPSGSMILIQEAQSKHSENPRGTVNPMTVTLDTVTSTRIMLPFLSGGAHVFRVYPQRSLCYGYGLQIESDQQVDFQEPSTYWRNICDVQVINSDGTHPVLLPHTWNILFKHNIEFALPAAANGRHELEQHIDLHLDLHLSDAMLAPYVHISIVNDRTSEVKRLSSLCSSVALPIQEGTQQPHEYTIIVDCSPQDFHVPEGKWHLSLGSNWSFKASFSHPMRLTAFGGTYEANKPLLCFRDVVMAPKKSIWTSFELKLLADDTVVENLAVKLEVIDMKTEQLLSESFAIGEVRLLQLPRRPQNGDEPEDEKSGYIIQGSIDRSRCFVPDDFCSVRPFRNRVGSNVEVDAVKESDERDEATSAIATSFPSSRAPTGLKWRLNCWSVEEVKLDADRTKENKYEAVRASWAESAKDRDTNGAVSRLLFLGKLDAAEAKMKLDGVSEDQSQKLKARMEWLENASTRMTDGSYLELPASRGDGRTKTAEDFAEEDRVLKERITATQAELAQTREERLAAKEQRAQEVKDLVQSVRDQRAAALKKRRALWHERDAILQCKSAADSSAQSA